MTENSLPASMLFLISVVLVVFSFELSEHLLVMGIIMVDILSTDIRLSSV